MGIISDYLEQSVEEKLKEKIDVSNAMIKYGDSFV